jgi:hypothetical protein
MTEAEIHRVIKGVPETNEVFVAIHTLLKNAYDAELEVALASESKNRQRAYDAGRAASLKGMLDDIKSLRERSFD